VTNVRDWGIAELGVPAVAFEEEEEAAQAA
jgi:hypothetical protein